jgi:hypothetical protein
MLGMVAATSKLVLVGSIKRSKFYLAMKTQNVMSLGAVKTLLYSAVSATLTFAFIVFSSATISIIPIEVNFRAYNLPVNFLVLGFISNVERKIKLNFIKQFWYAQYACTFAV